MSDYEFSDDEIIPRRRAPPISVELKYNTSLGRAPTKHTYTPPDQLKRAADLALKLVPIRLDVDLEGLRIQDCFTWNLNEASITPEQFAVIYAEDIDSPLASQLIPLIAQAIREQCQSMAAVVEEDLKPELVTSEMLQEEVAYGDFRIVIKIEHNVGSMYLRDQFEWPLFSNSADPEAFALKFCQELGIAGEFAPTIAFSIREQVCLARLDFDEAVSAQDFNSAIRDGPEVAEFETEYRELNRDEIERILKEKERNSRRLRRSQKFTPINRAGSFGSLRATRSSRYSLVQSPQKVALKNYNPTNEELSVYSQYNPQMAQAYAVAPTTAPLTVNTRNENIAKQIDMMRQASISPVKKSEDDHAPPAKHRGFGASAQVFNQDGNIEVGEFRKNWRCSWCLLSGKFTPTLRRGPLGSKTLCNACGIWYAKHNSMPEDRYHEHAETS